MSKTLSAHGRVGRSLAVLIAATFMLTTTVSQAQTRPYRLASTAVQTVPGETPLFKNSHAGFSMTELAADVDVITIFAEYLGIPFQEFVVAAAPPADHPWTVKMEQLAADVAAANRPVLLELALVRDSIVPYAREVNDELVLDSNWAPVCLDFNTPVGDYFSIAYKNYALWMSQLFDPAYLVILIEMNLYYIECGGNTDSWNALVDLERDAYDWVKSVNPDLPIFPSFKLEDLYEHEVDGFDEEQYQALANIKRDRFGVSTYPYGFRKSDGGFINPYDLPADYFSRIYDLHPEEQTMIISETGWISDSIGISDPGGCIAPFPYSSESFAEGYLQFVLYSGFSTDIELINWWSNRDSLPRTTMGTCYAPATAPDYLECNGELWCEQINQVRNAGSTGNSNFDELVFKAFGTMGIRDYDGTAKVNHVSVWDSILALPWVP